MTDSTAASPVTPRPRSSAAHAAFLMLLMLMAAHDADAAETQWWNIDRAAEHAQSELRGTTVRPEGTITLGPRTDSDAADSLGTIWAIALLRDGSVALAGDRGRIDRWTEARGVRPWLSLPVGQVLSLASDGDGVLAGTAPEGAIYRIDARGDTSLVVRTGERYVWALAPGTRGVWYAATGTRGRVMRIEGGRARVVLDSDESNLVSLLADGKGGVYAGGDSKGRVLHLAADGTMSTVFDAAEDEVRALALGADGALYAAALTVSAVSGAGAVAAGEIAGDEPEATAVAPAAPSAGGRAVIYRIVPDSSAALWWVAPQPLIYALARGRDGIVAATGNRAGVYSVAHANGGAAWLAAPQGQITALAVGTDGKVYAAASNPGALWRLGPARAERGELISSVLDARRLARFGRIAWRGDARGGRVALETRSGNTDVPDTTWSSWRATGSDNRNRAPAARYLQWKAVLAGGDPRVESVDAAWREGNLPPRVEDISVAPQGAAFREGDMMPRSEPVTQTLPGGQKVEYSIPSPATPEQLRALPSWAQGVRTIQWKGTDPNGDPLRYRVDVGRSAEGPWVTLGKELQAPAFTWDTHALADGGYRVRVTATDVTANAVGEERSADALSEPFQVDNTPPEITAFTATAVAGGIRVEGSARDAVTPLARIEVSIDHHGARAVTPDGGFADDLTASFRALIPDIEAGEHSIGVRVIDLAGNTARRTARVTVTGR